jgi:hypothetical protein
MLFRTHYHTNWLRPQRCVKPCVRLAVPLLALLMLLIAFVADAQAQTQKQTQAAPKAAPKAAPNQDELETILEFIAQNSAIVPQLDLLERYADDPLPLRTSNPQELTQLFGLPPQLARRIMAAVGKRPTLTLDELATTLALAPEYAALLRLCTSLEAAPELASVATRNNTQSKTQGNTQGNTQAKRGIERESEESKTTPRSTPTSAADKATDKAASRLGGLPFSAQYRARAVTYVNPPKGLTNGAFQGDGLGLFQRVRIIVPLRTAPALASGRNAASTNTPAAQPRSHDQLGDTHTHTHTLLEAHCAGQKDIGERSVVDFLSGYVAAEFRLQAPSHTPTQASERVPVRAANAMPSAAQLAQTSQTAHSPQAPLADGKLRVVAGDFLVQSGMGTMLWRAFGAKKGADVIAPAAQYAFGIEPYRSVLEQQFFRGAAAQLTTFVSPQTQINAMVWASALQRSASVDTLLNEARSLDTDGYFRTLSEISKKDNLLERSLGAGFELRTQTNFTTPLSPLPPVITASATALALDYDKTITSSSTSAFSGKSGVLASVSVTASAGASFLASEVVRDAQGFFAGRMGVQSGSGAFEYAAAFRIADPQFRSPFGYNFGEFSRPANEQGFYASVLWRGLERWRLAFYVDSYSSLAPTSTVPVPIKGLDVFSEARFDAGSALGFPISHQL